VRLVEITIPAGKREAVLSALDDEGVDYVLTDETSGREFTGIVSFPLPTNAVEPVLDRLREDAGIEEDAYTVILNAETVVSRRFEALTERYEEEPEATDRIAREEVRTRAEEMAPRLRTYVVMTAVSAIVATAGLLLNSPAIVVGSMVIAPLIGPAMATSVGTVIDDRDLFVRGVRLQLLGGLLAVASAAAFAFLVKSLNLVPPGLDVTTIEQVSERLSPDFLSLAVALAAGVAGALSLSSGVSAALVGVMIAAALVPPTAVIGIGIAWGLPSAVLGSTVLVLVNFLGINLSAMVVLWYTGYRPENWFRLDEARTATVSRVGVLVAAILVLSVFLGGVTYASVQTATFQDQTAREVTRLLDSPPYAELSLIDLSFSYHDDLVFRTPQRVTVTVGRPVGGSYPTLASDIQRRIATATGREVDVRVRFVDVQSAQPSKGSSGS